MWKTIGKYIIQFVMVFLRSQVEVKVVFAKGDSRARVFFDHPVHRAWITCIENADNKFATVLVGTAEKTGEVEVHAHVVSDGGATVTLLAQIW